MEPTGKHPPQGKSPSPTSPSLDVISSGYRAGREAHEVGGGAERRRLARISLTSEQFRLSANDKIFSVADLSVGGMALRMIEREDLRLFPVGTLLKGVLNLGGEKIEVHARVRHLKAELVGCQFEPLQREQAEILERFLDPASLGADLRPMPAPSGSVIWYHGPTGTDLVLHRGVDGGYRQLALYVLGTYVQWDDERGVGTGRIRSTAEKPEEQGIFRFETLLLDADAAPDEGKKSIAKTLILSSNLPQDLKGWVVRRLG